MVWLVRRMLLSLVALAALVLVASAETASAASPASTAGPATVLAPPSAGAISAGQNFTCGVRTEGILACWGDDANRQVTDMPAGTFLQVSSGSAFACGIRTGGTLACWGDDGMGQVSGMPAGTFTQVSAGGFHACGLKTGGSVTCWGYNQFGQASPPGGTFIQISSGGFHTCGLKDDGSVTCWGYSRFGQASAPAGSFTQVSSGDLHTCAVQADATLACWGQLSLGRSTPPPGAFSQVSAGESHTCGVVQSDASVACWGYDASGQASPPAGAFTEVSAGGSHSCGVKTDGTVACWGADSFLQLTNTPAGTFTPKADTTPPVINLPPNITTEATGPSGAVVTYAVTAADPDDAATVACTPVSGATFPAGVTTVACTATDTNGNTANGTFTVTVQDTTPPALTLPANITAEATGPSGAAVSYTATASDAVDGPVTPSCSQASGSTFALGSTPLNCTATDTNGNSANGSFTVTVRDTTPPALTLPANLTAEATGPSGAAVTYTATASDTVDGSVTPSCSPASGSTFALGSTTVNCSATDAHGTTASGTFTITVEDTTPPALTLPANMTTAATSGSGAVVTYDVSATDPDNLASDLTISCTPASGSIFTTGATTITCKATDPAGNSSTGSFQVTVVDFSMGAISPVTVPVGGTASASVAVNSVGGFNSAVALSASGAPAGVSVTFNPSSVTPASGGSASSTLTLHLSPMVTPTTFTLTVTGTFEGVSHSTALSVTVTVSSPAISDVIGQMLVVVCVDNAGVANALTSKLTAEQGAIAGGHPKTAINILSAFIDQVHAQSGKHISVSCTIGGVTFDAALVLITDARSLMDSIAVSATPNPITGSVHTAAGSGVAEAIVTLTDSTGATLATATTDITGFYFFATTGVLTPGSTYTVTVTVPIGLAAASPDSQTFIWSGNGEVSLAAFTTA